MTSVEFEIVNRKLYHYHKTTMKVLVITVLSLLSLELLAQDFSQLGIDDSPLLNGEESLVLNQLLEDQRDAFDFDNKKVAFFTGSLAGTIIEKSACFKGQIVPWLQKGDQPQISMIELNENEKRDSGGYDVLVFVWIKFTPTARKRASIIEELGAKS